MKTYKYIFFFSFLNATCAKEKSFEGGPGNGQGSGQPSPAVKNEWEFRENGIRYYGPVDTAYLTKEDNSEVLTLSGKSFAGNEQLVINLRVLQGIKPGKTYQTSLEEVRFIYKQGDNIIYSAIPYESGDVYITVTSIDPTKVTGTFRGLVNDIRGKSVSITDGKISSPLKTNGSPQSAGSVLFWAEQDCNGPIRVKVNNQPGEINVFTGFTPLCGDAGRATYQLTPGTYPWVAYCGTDSVSGNVDVRPGGCSKVKVFFPIRPAPVTTTNLTCKIERIEYGGRLLGLYNTIISDYVGSQINKLHYYVVPAPVILPHVVTYLNDTIIIDGESEYKKWFVKDGSGKIIEYRGLQNPAIFYPRTLVSAKYYYDALNNMVRRVQYNEYNNISLVMDFEWHDGNIVKIVETYPIGGNSKQITLEYFDKAVKSMPFIYESAIELLMFQSLINFGNPVRNALRKITSTGLGNPVSYDVTNYVIDDNGYVLKLSRVFDYQMRTDYSFGYKCF